VLKWNCCSVMQDECISLKFSRGTKGQKLLFSSCLHLATSVEIVHDGILHADLQHCHQLCVPHRWHSAFGCWVFSVADPTVWNLLSHSLWDLMHFFDSFWHDLKIFFSLLVHVQNCGFALYNFMIDIVHCNNVVAMNSDNVSGIFIHDTLQT